jgi:enoyl-CoA hydratase/3-hydroxyacyl-CoA dehydrogenase
VAFSVAFPPSRLANPVPVGDISVKRQSVRVLPWNRLVVREIAVLGAGIMGHGIAELAALSGYNVRLYDIAEQFLRQGMERIKWSLSKFVEKGRLSGEESSRVLERISTHLELAEAVRGVDFVVEAVPEDLSLKRRVFADLDRVAPASAILASNTSTLPISEIGEATTRPELVVGMHFFNPPVILPLVEVTAGSRTAPSTVDVTIQLAKSMGKEVVVCRKDVPGFIVNRVLAFITNEAAWIVERGEAGILEVDSTCVHKLGLPMGVFELADFTGVDTTYRVVESVLGRSGLAGALCPLLRRTYEMGYFGRKTGRGFYQYTGADWERPPIPRELADRVDPVRIIGMGVNAALWLLRNGVASRDDIEKAIRLGLNYPRGILALGEEYGLSRISETIQMLGQRYPALSEYYRPEALMGDSEGR